MAGETGGAAHHRHHHRHRRHPAIAPRPVVIHQPSTQEAADHAQFPSYEQVLVMLRRALFDNGLMAELRRIAHAISPRSLESDWKAIETVAREIAAGRMVLFTRTATPNKPPKRATDAAGTPPPSPPYTAAHDKAYRAWLGSSDIEGRINHMYRDSEGYVTVGVGKMLPNAKAAEGLRFYRRSDSGAASAAEIADDYAKVMGQRAAMPAGRYAADLVMREPDIDRLLDEELEKAERQAMHLFPEWASFPHEAQLALLDMTYNMGEGRALTAREKSQGQHEHGVFQYHHLRKAVADRDWRAAADLCERKKLQAKRNVWTRNQFLAAAKIAPPKPPAHRALDMS